MAEQLRFHPLVADDLKAAVGWYDDISPSLGDRFRSAVEQQFDSLAESPESFGIVFQNARAARLAGFPYLMLFEHGADVVHILGVFHSASNPAKLRPTSNGRMHPCLTGNAMRRSDPEEPLFPMTGEIAATPPRT